MVSIQFVVAFLADASLDSSDKTFLSRSLTIFKAEIRVDGDMTMAGIVGDEGVEICGDLESVLGVELGENEKCEGVVGGLVVESTIVGLVGL